MMSLDVIAGINYALTRRHYDNDDYVAISFGPTQDYYVVGTMAYINDANVVDVERGWCLYAHGQPAAPAFLATVLAALGLTWPSQVPAFEAKDILFYATQDCYVRFEGASRVRHYIPANTFMRFHRRCFMFFVQQVSAAGTLMAWMEG
jgi:hypothetical protein